jgi:mannose-1-phosphate guanylyltransferase/mannose-6-phosphate isomerase
MTTPSETKIRPAILSGGAGTRLWPLSRELHPKQLLALTGERSLLQETVMRVSDPALFFPPIVVCNEAHRFIVAEHLREIDCVPAAIVLEPEGRNTAPAAAVAAHLVVRDDNDGLILVLPSDHHIANPEALYDAILRGTRAALDGALVTFGISPTGPETGYGYLQVGARRTDAEGVYDLDRFIEKPDRAAASEMIDDGRHLWNAGIFLFRARRYLEDLARLEPAIAGAAQDALAGAKADFDFLRLASEPFLKCPSRSIDYAVMEHAVDAAVVACDIGWSDVGTWSSLWQLGSQDEHGNVLVGDVLVEDSRNSYIHSPRTLVAAIGVRDLAIVVTDDAVLVTPRAEAQKVRAVVDKLKASDRPEHSIHKRVYRPWGYYQGIDGGEGFQVKQIAVYPGRSLSLQKHARRAEHWVVVDGRAIVTRDAETFELKRNQSTFIPIGAVHRLENPGPDLLKLIEVQSGDYLGEDDIVRLEDDYGRD